MFSSPEADPSGSGEGRTFLGKKLLETDENGNASFTLKRSATGVGRVTATATGPSGSTSEFSEAVRVR